VQASPRPLNTPSEKADTQPRARVRPTCRVTAYSLPHDPLMVAPAYIPVAASGDLSSAGHRVPKATDEQSENVMALIWLDCLSI